MTPPRRVVRALAALGAVTLVALAPDAAEQQLAFTDGLPAAMISFMLGDLRRGNRLELPWLAGAVVRLGRELGLPTPMNSAVYAALKPYAEGTVPHAKPAPHAVTAGSA